MADQFDFSDFEAPGTTPAFLGADKSIDLGDPLAETKQEPAPIQLDIGVPDLIDNDEVDTMDFVLGTLPNAVKALSVSLMAAGKAEVGRRIEEIGNPSAGWSPAEQQLANSPVVTEEDQFNKFMLDVDAGPGNIANWPGMAARGILKAIGFDTEQYGQEVQDEANAVWSETQKDLKQASADAGDSLGRKIALDVAASATTVLPAIAVGRIAGANAAMGILGGITAMDTTQKAVEAGMDWESARKTGLRDAIFEALPEKLPLTTLLEIPESKEIVKKSLHFLAQEVGTEMVTTALQSFNAASTYNPNMTWGDFGDAMLSTVLATPFSAGLQLGAVKALDAGIKGVERAVDSVNNRRADSAGAVPFTDLGQEVVDASKGVQKANAEVDLIKQQLDEITESIAKRGLEQERFLEDSGRMDTVNNFLEQGLAKGQRYLDNNSIALTPGQSETIFNDPTLTYELEGKATTNAIPGPGQVAVALPNRSLVQGLERAARTAKNDGLRNRLIEEIKAKQQQVKLMWRDARRSAGVVKQWMSKYAPDMKVLVVPRTGIGVFPPRSEALGFNAVTADGVNIISVDTGGTRTGNSNSVRMAYQGDTLAHEFGHALVRDTFSKQPEEVQRALVNEWKLAISKMPNQTLEQFLNANVMPAEVMDILARVKPEAKGILMKDLSGGLITDLQSPGMMSFQEWMANQMGRKHGHDEVAQSFFKSVRDVAKRFYEGSGKKFSSAKTFDLYLKRLATGVKLRGAINRQQIAISAYRAALNNARVTAHGGPMAGFLSGGNTIVPGAPNPPTIAGFRRGGLTGSSLDRFSKFIKLTAGLDQMSKINKHIPGVPEYYKSAAAMWMEKMKWTEKANGVLREWLSGKYVKGAKRREALSDFLFEVDAKSDQLQRKLTGPELDAIRLKHGISQGEFDMANKIWQSFEEAINEVEAALVQNLYKNIVSGNTVQISQQIQDIRKDFAKIRNRHYMPHSRFGRYSITATVTTPFTDANGKTWKPRDIAFFGTYESEGAAKKAKAELEKELRGRANLGVGEIQDDVRELLDLPPTLVKMLANKLNLDPKQMGQLADLQTLLAPGQSFKKQMVGRKSVPGYSKDALRVYADYMRKFSGHVSRLKHVDDMQLWLDTMKNSAMFLRQQGDTSVKRERIIQWYADHFSYLMNPGNELAGLRAFGFMWYLGFLPKAAVVNLSQLPLVTGPYLAAKYNDVAAGQAILEGMYNVMRKPFTKGGSIDPEYQAMFDELTKRGLIDESIATELAALSEGGFLHRGLSTAGLGGPTTALYVQRGFEASALMFQAAEKFNRRITAYAAYKLARKNGMGPIAAIEEAALAVRETQFEYGRINRPEMMRGAVKASVFMFWQYTTNMLWFMRENKTAAARSLVLLFLLAGLEGLPFAENVLDIADVTLKKVKEWTGWADPKKGARDMLTDFLNEWEDDPMLSWLPSSHTVMKGVTSDLFGITDLSSSLSMGGIIPGTEYLARDGQAAVQQQGALADMGGALVNIPLSILSAVNSDNPDVWKVVDAALPNFAKSTSTATRWAVRGAETDRSGATVMEFDTANDYKDVLAIMGRGLGFQSSKVSNRYEQIGKAKDAINYYTARHNALTGRLNYAFATGNSESISSALDAIVEFNSQVPFPEMMIQTRSLTQSLKRGQETRLMKEMGLPDKTKFINLQTEIFDRYEK